MMDYVELMKVGIKEAEINNVRNHTKSGHPIGSDSFLVKKEQKLDRTFKVMPQGRPKKGKNNKWDVFLILNYIVKLKTASQ